MNHNNGKYYIYEYNINNHVWFFNRKDKTNKIFIKMIKDNYEPRKQ